MKKLLCALLSAAMLAGCTAPALQTAPPETVMEDSGTVRIRLEDGSMTVTAPEGMDKNAVASSIEPEGYTVVRISAPGTYILSGKLSAGQIAVDLGESAKTDPNAVVTLILDGLDITCGNAPAIIFYNVYESGDPLAPAGANVVLAEGSENFVTGSHTEDYDGAFYSRMSMSVSGDGSLSITGDNEGLCSELHLTINSGDISIQSGNDGINANEDGASVVTVNGGTLTVVVTGETGEGDGIDSNGSIYINGGSVFAYACGASMDSGIDADQGIYLNGGTVIATGNMLDAIEESSQTHAVFSFAQTQPGGGSYTLKNEKGTVILEVAPPNAFTSLVYSAPALVEGTYTLWSGETQLEGMKGSGGMGSFIGGGQPIERPDWPDKGPGDGDVEIPPQPTQPIVTQGTVQPPQGEQPENMPVPQFPQGGEGNMPVPNMPQNSAEMPMPDLPEGVQPPQGGGQNFMVIPATGVVSTDFAITRGANYFSSIRPAE